MRVRPETAADYAAVARVHVRAFGDRADEAVIVALLRQRASYTPGLSLVAEVDGVIAGHVLFTPGILPLMGQAVPAVLLAPLAVDPAFQRRGIGGALIEAGHEAARQHGAALSLLLGHPEYYPRFGYQVQSYGIARCVVDVAALPATGPLTARKPAAADLPALMRLWEHEEGAVDFSLRPDAALLDWLSPNPLITATVYERGGSVVGFTRIHQAAPLFLALHRMTVQVGHSGTGLADLGYVTFLEEDKATRDRQQRRDIRSDEISVIGQTNHHRTAAAGEYQQVRVGFTHHDQRVGAMQFADGGTHGRVQVRLALQVVVDPVRNAFGVGI